jgi:hypothetical protein
MFFDPRLGAFYISGSAVHLASLGTGSRFIGAENRVSGECADDAAVAWNNFEPQPRIVWVIS